MHFDRQNLPASHRPRGDAREFPPKIPAPSARSRLDPFAEVVEARRRHDLTAELITRLISGRIEPSPSTLAAVKKLHDIEGMRVAMAFRAYRAMTFEMAERAGGRP
jgi:hypothetical protein